MNPVEIKDKMDPLKHEWFAHMPYESPKENLTTSEMCEFVALDGATGRGGRNKPYCHLYGTQLRAIF